MRAFRLSFFLAAVLPFAAQCDDLPLSAWDAPPYWNRPGAASQESPEPAGRAALSRQPFVAGPVALPFIALPPCRLVDTRGNAPLTGGFLPAATVRNYTLTGVCGVPANAQAISLNATVVKPVGPGFLVLYPQGGAFPPVSTLNYLGNDVIVNAAVVPLSGTGGISVALGVSGGDVLLDTNGYYAAVPAVTSGQALRVVRGWFMGSNGTIFAGSGFTVVRNAVGTYTIMFSPAFSDAPAISLTAAAASAGVTFGFSMYSNAGFSFTVYSAGALIDLPINFIVIGPP